MTFLEERDFSDAPLIPEYFRGKTVFITGGSGFLGKVLIEKLLYSCSELDRIYILLRPKKGVASADRKDEIYKLACFDRLRSEKPGLFESKVFVIPGDVSEPDLAMSTEDRALLVKRTNIIFHSAASVRFNDPLKVASNLNLLGTKRMIEMAKEMHNLDCFVHVSTAFSNKLRAPLEERLYAPVMSWRELLEICEMDDHTIQVLTPKLLNGMANTYVLTKHLAEHMVCEEKGNLPIVIVRPSVVASSYNEPIRGWLDNFNGPAGLITAVGIGLTGVTYGDANSKSDYIPVDLVVRSLICSAWARGTKKLESSDGVPIYNACASGRFNFSPAELLVHGMSAYRLVPFECAILPQSCSFTTSQFMFYAHVFFTRLILFILLDLVLKLSSKKPRLVKLIRRVCVANIAVETFLLNEWTFKNDNFIKLCSALKEGDVKEFKFKVENIDVSHYFYHAVVGGKTFLLKEKMEFLPKARRINNGLNYSFSLIKILIYAFITWYIVSSNTVKKLLNFE